MIDYSKYISEPYKLNGEIYRDVCGIKIIQAEDESLNLWANRLRVDNHIKKMHDEKDKLSGR